MAPRRLGWLPLFRGGCRRRGRSGINSEGVCKEYAEANYGAMPKIELTAARLLLAQTRCDGLVAFHWVLQ